MGVLECCSAFMASLPGPALSFLPSLFFGTIVASLILLFAYQRETKLPLKVVLADIFSAVFCCFPSSDRHSSGVYCRNPNCIRCKKYEELEKNVVKKFDDMKIKEEIKSSRLEISVKAIKKRHYSGDIIEQKSETDKGTSEGSQKKMSHQPQEQKPTIFHMVDLVANPYWHDLDAYNEEKSMLKLNFSIIINEFTKIFQSFKNGDSAGWKNNDIPHGHWCIFPFIDQGVVNEENCDKCPNTAALISCLPSVMKNCAFGNASFSLLYPDSHIEPHCGPTNLRLRCHMGLRVPNGSWLEVAGKQYKWKEQDIAIFDDSFEHSATFVNQENAAQAFPRAILMIDFWHPSVTPYEKNLLLELLAPM